MSQLQIILSVLTFYLFVSAWSQVNYCAPNLCRNGTRHTACNNTGVGFGINCSRSARRVPIRGTLYRKIVGWHNILRNRIAQGRFNPYRPAIRMASMSWSPELTRLAWLNVRRCILRRDPCHNTPIFRFSGQNGGRVSWRKRNNFTNISVENLARRLINAWFLEKQKCSVQEISSLTLAIVRKCGHFTTMIQEKNNAVGCAILSENRRRRTMMYMICNYAYNNVIRIPTYRMGRVASNCTSGRNRQFRALCSKRERYNHTNIQW